MISSWGTCEVLLAEGLVRMLEGDKRAIIFPPL